MSPSVLEAFSPEILKIERTFQDVLHTWKFSEEDLKPYIEKNWDQLLLALDIFKPISGLTTGSTMSIKDQKFELIETEKKIASKNVYFKTNTPRAQIIFKQYVASQYCSTKFRTYLTSSETLKYPSESIEKEIGKQYTEFYFNERYSVLSLLTEFVLGSLDPKHPRHSLSVFVYSKLLGNDRGVSFMDRLLSQLQTLVELENVEKLKNFEFLHKTLKELHLLLELIVFLLYSNVELSEKFQLDFTEWALVTNHHNLSWLKNYTNELLLSLTRIDGLILTVFVHILDIKSLDYQCDQATDTSPRLLALPKLLLKILEFSYLNLKDDQSLLGLVFALFCRGVDDSFQERIALGEPTETSSRAIVDFINNPSDNIRNTTGRSSQLGTTSLVEFFFSKVSVQPLWSEFHSFLKPDLTTGNFPSVCKKVIQPLFVATVVLAPQLAVNQITEFHSILCLLHYRESLFEPFWGTNQLSQRAFLSLVQSTYPASPELLPELLIALSTNNASCKSAIEYLSSLTTLSMKFDPALRQVTQVVPSHDSLYEAKDNILTTLSSFIPAFSRGTLTKISGTHIVIWSHKFNVWDDLQSAISKLASDGGEGGVMDASEQTSLIDFILPLLNFMSHVTKVSPQLLENISTNSEVPSPLYIVQNLLVMCDRWLSATNPPFSLISSALELCSHYLPSHPVLIDFITTKLADSPHFGALDILSLENRESSYIYDNIMALIRIANIFTPIYLRSLCLDCVQPSLSHFTHKIFTALVSIFFSTKRWLHFNPSNLVYINGECLKTATRMFDSVSSLGMVTEANKFLELVANELLDSEKAYSLANKLNRAILAEPEDNINIDNLFLHLNFLRSLLVLQLQNADKSCFNSPTFINTLLSYKSISKARLLPTLFSYVNFEHPLLALAMELVGLLSSAAHIFKSGLKCFALQLSDECSTFERNISHIITREVGDLDLFQTMWYSLAGLVTYQHELFPSLYDVSLDPLSLVKAIEYTLNNWDIIFSKFPRVALSFSHFLAVLWKQREHLTSLPLQSSVWNLINRILTAEVASTSKAIEFRAIQVNFLTVVKLEASYIGSSGTTLTQSYQTLFFKLVSPQYVERIIGKWLLLTRQSPATSILEKDLNATAVKIDVLKNFHFNSDTILGWLGRKDLGLVYNTCYFKEVLSMFYNNLKNNRISQCFALVDHAAYWEQSRHALMQTWSSFFQIAYSHQNKFLWSSQPSNFLDKNRFHAILMIKEIINPAHGPVHPLGHTSLMKLTSEFLEDVQKSHLRSDEIRKAIQDLVVVLLNIIPRRRKQLDTVHIMIPKHRLTNLRAFYKSLGIALQLLLPNPVHLDITDFNCELVCSILAKDYEYLSSFESTLAENKDYLSSCAFSARLFHLEVLKLLLNQSPKWKSWIQNTKLMNILFHELQLSHVSPILAHQIIEVLCRMTPHIPDNLKATVRSLSSVFIPPDSIEHYSVQNPLDRLQSYNYAAYLDLAAQLNLDIGPVHPTLEALLRLVSSQDKPLQPVQLACVEGFLRVYIQGGVKSGAGHINLLQLTSSLIGHLKGERLIRQIANNELALILERGSKNYTIWSWVNNSLLMLLRHLLKSDAHNTKPFIVISCVPHPDLSFGSLLDILKIFSPLTYSSNLDVATRQQAIDLVITCLNLFIGQLLNFLNYDSYPARLQQDVLYDVETELQFYLDSAPDALASFINSHPTRSNELSASLSNLAQTWHDTRQILNKASEFQ